MSKNTVSPKDKALEEKVEALRIQAVNAMIPLYGQHTLKDGNYIFEKSNSYIAKELGYSASDISRYLSFYKHHDDNQPRIRAYESFIKLIKATARKKAEMQKEIEKLKANFSDKNQANKTEDLEELKSKISELDKKNDQLKDYIERIKDAKKPFIKVDEDSKFVFVFLIISLIILYGAFHVPEIKTTIKIFRTINDYKAEKHEIIITNDNFGLIERDTTKRNLNFNFETDTLIFGKDGIRILQSFPSK